MKHRPSIHEKAGTLRDSVFAANDGLITTFAIIAGSTGAKFPARVVLILGLVNLLADGISMGSGNYLGVKSEIDYEKAKGKRIDNGNLPLKHGIITFATFGFVGFLPLIPYAFDVSPKFELSLIIVGTVLFLIGTLRGKLTKKGWFSSGTEMLVVGGFAALVAYIVGFLANKYLM